MLELTDRELFDYPFIYIVEPGELQFREEEVRNLRRYLLSGGFLMVDDFWGEAAVAEPLSANEARVPGARTAGTRPLDTRFSIAFFR